MTISTKQHNAIALIIFCALLVFIRLNSALFNEAESLIIFKANLLVQFNGWLDLAPYSTFESIYTLPPMSIWLTAVMSKYVGDLPLHLRLVSALFSAMSLVLIYQIARRIVGYQVALLAPALLASTLLWNDFARQVSPEIPAAMFSLVGLWSLCMLHERDDLTSKIGFAALYGIGISGAFLSSFAAGGITVLISLPFLLSSSRTFLWTFSGILLGLIAPIAWYSHVLFTFSTLYSPFSVLAIWSSAATLLLSQPFVILAVSAPFLIYQLRKSTTNTKISSLPENAVLLWFICLVISTGFTKYSTILLLTPAAILLSLRSFELISSPHKARIAWILLMELIVTTICSLKTSFADFVLQIFNGQENILTIIICSAITVLIVSLGLMTPRVRLYILTSKLLRFSGIVIPVLLILRIVVSNISRETKFDEIEAMNIPAIQDQLSE
ncbi:MAG: glycosyltransferase family 39 protein [Ignavibacteria bacterium]|nr:glycosyltransferase family 39 protein [Ignavibacteria bacterium]